MKSIPAALPPTQTQEFPMTAEIASACAALDVGAPSRYAGLTMFPLFHPRQEPAADPSYLVLDEALAEGSARATEISEHGSLPVLRFSNRAVRPVLLLDGDELTGCKQNRILNLTILAPAGTDIEIPVSCVEMGRWSRQSAQFSSAGRTMYAGLRARKLAQVNQSLKERGRASSDQSAIWDSIARKSSRMGSTSRTMAMSGVFEESRNRVEEIVRRLVAQPGQVGAAFALHGRLAGVEWFDSPVTLRKFLDAIVSGYALDAIDHGYREDWAGAPVDMMESLQQGIHEVDPTREPSLEEVRAMLARVAASKPDRSPAVGLGEDIRIDEPGLIGAALVEGGRVVHLCAFSHAGEPAGRSIRGRRRQPPREDLG